MCNCEDRPCCGHLAEERTDAYYAEERSYYGDHDEPDYGYDEPEDRDPEDCAHEDTEGGECIYCGTVIFLDADDDLEVYETYAPFYQEDPEPDIYAGTYSEE